MAGVCFIGFVCLFVCSFRVQFNHLPIIINHEDNDENAEKKHIWCQLYKELR